MLHAITTACRALWRRPGFTTTAVVTLGLAAAANATILAVVYGILLKPLPYQDPDRMVAAGRVDTSRTRTCSTCEITRRFLHLARCRSRRTMAVTGSGIR